MPRLAASPVLALLPLLLAACATVGGGRAADEAAIRAGSAAWAEALQTKDLDRLVGLYARDAIILEPGEEAIRGHAAIRAYYVPFLEMDITEVRSTPTEVVVARSGELAYEMGTYRFAVNGRNGAVLEDRGRYTVVWTREGGAWRMLREFSQDGPE
jgi:uncharacterized protein (TIGR02246 family)